MKKICLWCISLFMTISAHSALVEVSGMGEQKNYIDISSVKINHQSKTVSYNTLIFFDHNHSIERFRNSVIVKNSTVLCEQKSWYNNNEYRKSLDQKQILETMDVGIYATLEKPRPIIHSGPVKYIYDHYC